MPTALPVRLLVVENESVWSELLVVVVRRMGFEVVGPAASAAEALALLKAGPPVAAALLDIGLDGQPDGIALAGLLQAKGRLPVVFLTGLEDDKVRARALAVGPVFFLRKQLSQGNLEQLLADVLALALRPLPAPSRMALPDYHHRFVRQNGDVVRLCLTKVHYLETEGNYTTLRTRHKSYTLRRPLHELALELAPAGFVQNHRGYVFNLRHLKGLTANQTKVKVGDQTLPLARSHRETVLAYLQWLE